MQISSLVAFGQIKFAALQTQTPVKKMLLLKTLLANKTALQFIHFKFLGL
jgi:hypothetical protein